MVPVAGALAVGALRADGSSESGRELGSGSAWFASPATGRATLLDGIGHRAGQTAAADKGDRLTVTQTRNGALVVNHDRATLARIAGATWERSTPVKIPIAASGDAVAVMVAGPAAWVVAYDQGLAQQFDPETLSWFGEPLTLPAGAHEGTAAVAPDGTLWTLGREGEVRALRNARLATTTRVAAGPEATLVMAGHRPVVVDADRHAVLALDPGSGEAAPPVTLDLPPEDRALVSGARTSPWVLAVASRAGVLHVIDLDGGTARAVNLDDPPDQRTYARPVEKDGLVFVPRTGAAERRDGTVAVVDPRAPAERRVRLRLELHLAGFALMEHDGRVWFGDGPRPGTGDHVGVITDDLRAMTADIGDPDFDGAAKSEPVPAPERAEPAPATDDPPNVPENPPNPPAVPPPGARPAPGGGPGPQPGGAPGGRPEPVRVIGPDHLHLGETGVYRFTPEPVHSSITWSAVGGDPGDRDGPTFSLTMIHPETVYIRVTLGRPDGSATPPSAPFAVQFVADPPAPEAAPPPTAAEPPATTTTTTEAPTTTARTTTTTMPRTTTTVPTTTTTVPTIAVRPTFTEKGIAVWQHVGGPYGRPNRHEGSPLQGRTSLAIDCKVHFTDPAFSSNVSEYWYRMTEPYVDDGTVYPWTIGDYFGPDDDHIVVADVPDCPG
jgi:hypothetical protein